jgi:hypothetical protein
VWKGYLFTAVLASSTLIGSLSEAFYWYLMRIAGLRIRTALCTAIYRKALQLSNSSRRLKTGGKMC